jgi:hypothetical protein
MRYFTFFLLLVMAPFLVPANAQADRTAYFNVKTWRLTGTWTYTLHFQTVEVVDTTTRTRTYDAEVHARVQFRLVQSKTHSSKRYRWQLEKGFNPIAETRIKIVDFLKIKPKDGEETWSKMETTLDGKAQDGEARFGIEPGDGSYQLAAGFMSTPGKVKATNSQGGSQEVESPFSFNSGALDCAGIASGMTFGSGRPDAIVSAPLDNPAGSFLSFLWKLTPWEQEPEHEATLDLSDHTWLPDPTAPVNVVVKWEGKAEKVRVFLENISVEPGTCLNDEVKDAAKETDLTIASQGDWAVTKEGEGAGTKYTAVRPLPKQDPPQQVELEVKATDYGAWGSVHAEVLLDGKWKDAKFNGKTTMAVPYDLDENHIADQWEDENGAKGKPADADDDETPPGNGYKGDGLTNYEEYRGFVEDGNHFRTDPRIKNVFFCDETATATGQGGDNSLATEGIALFEAVTKLKVHAKLTKTELSEGRIVNRNHKEGPHKVDQHGVPIRRGPAGEDAEAMAATSSGAIGPPKLTAFVKLPIGTRYRRESGWSANSRTDHDIEDKVSTVAHELGHTVGMEHHGANMRYVLWKWVKQPDGQYRLTEQGYTDGTFGETAGGSSLIRAFFEVDGTEATYGGPPPGIFDPGVSAFKVLLGGFSGQHSGQENCIMRYPDGNAYESRNSPDVRFIPDSGQWVKRSTLCTSPVGTGINAGDHAPQPRYGDATKGNCLEQIVVNDAF